MIRFNVRGNDAGAGAVLVVIAIALVVVMGSAVVMLLGGSARISRVQNVADIAAEAGALAWVRGDTDPCERARLATSAAGAQLARCDVVGDTVTVEVIDPRPLPWWPQVRALARAGPAPQPLA